MKGHSGFPVGALFRNVSVRFAYQEVDFIPATCQ